MRLQKARPLGELRRKAVRGHNVRSKTLSVTQACHLSQSERLFEISIFRWDNVLPTSSNFRHFKQKFIVLFMKNKCDCSVNLFSCYRKLLKINLSVLHCLDISKTVIGKQLSVRFSAFSSFFMRLHTPRSFVF